MKNLRIRPKSIIAFIVMLSFIVTTFSFYMVDVNAKSNISEIIPSGTKTKLTVSGPSFVVKGSTTPATFSLGLDNQQTSGLVPATGTSPYRDGISFLSTALQFDGRYFVGGTMGANMTKLENGDLTPAEDVQQISFTNSSAVIPTTTLRGEHAAYYQTPDELQNPFAVSVAIAGYRDEGAKEAYTVSNANKGTLATIGVKINASAPLGKTKVYTSNAPGLTVMQYYFNDLKNSGLDNAVKRVDDADINKIFEPSYFETAVINGGTDSASITTTPTVSVSNTDPKSITITGANIGDVINIYDGSAAPNIANGAGDSSKPLSTPIATVTVTTASPFTINASNYPALVPTVLNPAGGSIYVTNTTPGKDESVPVQKTYNSDNSSDTPAETLTLNGPSTAKVGVPFTLEGIVGPSNATNKNVIYQVITSGASGIADATLSVTDGSTPNVTVTPTKDGTLTILAMAMGSKGIPVLSSTYTVPVSPATGNKTASFEPSTPIQNMVNNGTQTIGFTAKDSAGNPTGAGFTYTTTGPITVTGTNPLTIVANPTGTGPASITLTPNDGGASQTFNFNVSSGSTNVPATGFSITPSMPTQMTNGQSKTITVVPVGNGGVAATDPSVTATVKSGPATISGTYPNFTITPTGTGTVTIELKAGNGHTQTYTISVSDPITSNAKINYKARNTENGTTVSPYDNHVSSIQNPLNISVGKVFELQVHMKDIPPFSAFSIPLKFDPSKLQVINGYNKTPIKYDNSSAKIATGDMDADFGLKPVSSNFTFIESERYPYVNNNIGIVRVSGHRNLAQNQDIAITDEHIYTIYFRVIAPITQSELPISYGENGELWDDVVESKDMMLGSIGNKQQPGQELVIGDWATIDHTPYFPQINATGSLETRRIVFNPNPTEVVKGDTKVLNLFYDNGDGTFTPVPSSANLYWELGANAPGNISVEAGIRTVKGINVTDPLLAEIIVYNLDGDLDNPAKGQVKVTAAPITVGAISLHNADNGSGGYLTSGGTPITEPRIINLEVGKDVHLRLDILDYHNEPITWDITSGEPYKTTKTIPTGTGIDADRIIKIHGNSTGTDTYRVSVGGREIIFTVNVIAAPATNIRIMGTDTFGNTNQVLAQKTPLISNTVEINTSSRASDTYTAQVDPLNASAKDVVWSSSDESKVEIITNHTGESINVIYKVTGTVTLTATASSGISASITIKVDTLDLKVRFVNPPYTLFWFQTNVPIKAEVIPSNVNYKNIEFTDITSSGKYLNLTQSATSPRDTTLANPESTSSASPNGSPAKIQAQPIRQDDGNPYAGVIATHDITVVGKEVQIKDVVVNNMRGHQQDTVVVTPKDASTNAAILLYREADSTTLIARKELEGSAITFDWSILNSQTDGFGLKLQDDLDSDGTFNHYIWMSYLDKNSGTTYGPFKIRYNPAPADVTGKIELIGKNTGASKKTFKYNEDMNKGGDNLSIKIVSIQGDTVTAYPTATVVIDQDGYFTISNVPAGDNYYIQIERKGHLLRRVKVRTDSGNTDLRGAPIQLAPGELNKNSKIEIGDLIEFLLHYGNTSTMSGYSEYSDFDDSNAIGIQDLLLLLKYYNLSTDTYPNYNYPVITG